MCSAQAHVRFTPIATSFVCFAQIFQSARREIGNPAGGLAFCHARVFVEVNGARLLHFLMSRPWLRGIRVAFSIYRKEETLMRSGTCPLWVIRM
jgi:hypothetical protein